MIKRDERGQKIWVEKEEEKKKWSEKVEDLVESGDREGNISYLESKIETLNSNTNTSELVAALLELSKLYSSIGLSLKSDDIRARASSIQLRSPPSSSLIIGTQTQTPTDEPINNNVDASIIISTSSPNHANLESAYSSTHYVAPHASPHDDDDDDDDWEAIADRAPDELLSPPCLPEVSKLSLGVTEVKKVTTRRGRGTFSYKKQGLYSDEQASDSISCDGSVENLHEKSETISEARNLYCTHHVLVLDGFNPSTTTSDLERLFKEFGEHGYAIRWVNDTLALAVFRNPSVAREAYTSVHCSFKVRVLEEDDPIMSSISIKDLDPPRQRPKTSARTAQRLIAQELGVKLPSSFGSRELRKQEDARRNRIANRQILRDEAWGPDDIK